MKISSVSLKNFRSYKEKTVIGFDDFTALIGKNDSGKSTILEALEIFFDDKVKPDPGDLCVDGGTAEFEIGVTFCDLPATMNLDRGATSSLAEEYLLNANRELEVVKVFRATATKVSGPDVFAQAEHPSASGVSDLIQKSNPDLKKLVRERGLETKCNLSENPSMRAALYEHETELEVIDQRVPLNEANATTVWSAIERYLPLFVLFKSDRTSTDQDAEAQDPLKAAVKLALSEVEPELAEVSKKVREIVEGTARRTLDQLKQSYPDLADALDPQFKEPDFSRMYKIELQSDGGVPLNKRGSGVRRLVLMSFFQAEALRKKQEKAGESSPSSEASVVYAIEEPETSQHPDNQERIVAALKELAASGEQVVLTTHVPALASMMPIGGLRYIDVDPVTSQPRIREGDPDVFEDIASALGVLPEPLLSKQVSVAVLVEGPTDVEAILNLIDVLVANGDVSSFDLDQVLFLPSGGDTLKDWVERDYLSKLRIPQVTIFDSDLDDPEAELSDKKVKRLRDLNAKQDHTCFATRKREMENYVHPSAVDRLTNGLVSLPSSPELDFIDVEAIFFPTLKDAIDEQGLRFYPQDRSGTSIRLRKRSAKAIICSCVFAEMTASEIKERFAYTKDGQTRYEIIDWIETIRNLASK